MIRTTLILQSTPEMTDAIIDVYEEHDILQYSLDHSDAISSELSVATDGSGEVMITAVWPSVDAYQGWIDNPERERTGIILRELLGNSVGIGQTWEIIQVVSQ